MENLQNVIHQMGSCGIWCGSCAVANGGLNVLSSTVKQIVEDYGLKDWGPQDIDYTVFIQALTSISAMPVCHGCRQGGGRDDCEIRDCVEDKGLMDCTHCETFIDCPHGKLLETMRTGAAKAGIRVKQPDQPDTPEAWMEEMRDQWPMPLSVLADKG